MNSAFRAIPLAVIASICIDAQAKPVGPCIHSLEAKPTPADPTRMDPLRKPRCPIAIVYAEREPSDANAPGEPSERGGRVDTEAKLAGRSDASSIAPRRLVLHV